MKHKSLPNIITILLFLALPAIIVQAQSATSAALPFDFMADAIVSVSGQEGTELLEVTVFCSTRNRNYLAFIQSPPYRSGTSFIKKGDACYLYYPRYNAFINLDQPGQYNPGLPFLYPHFHLQEAPGYTVNAENAEHPAGSAVYSLPGEGYKAKVTYLEYAKVDNYYIPVRWQVTVENPLPLAVLVKLKNLTRTVLPEFIFTRAYLQFICGH